MVEALVRRLLANGGLRPDDIPAIRVAAMAFPAQLQEAGGTAVQVKGARLADAVTAMCDRLDGSDWTPVSSDDEYRSARMLVAQLGQAKAVEHAWSRIYDLTAGRDRLGVATWCRILDALEAGARGA